MVDENIIIFIVMTTLYMTELTVGFETNFYSNTERKHDNNHQLTRDLS